MNKYIIDLTTGENDNTAQYKAKNDIANILASIGYKEINYKYFDNHILKSFSLFKTRNHLKNCRSGIFVYQFPLGSKRVDPFLIKELKKNDSLKKVAIIHDLESLRNHSDDSEFCKKEISELDNFDGIIAQNHVMSKWIKSKGYKGKIVSISVFDYLNSELSMTKNKNNGIIYAGNLSKEKSGFLNNFESEIPVNVYGINPSEKYPTNIKYKGNFPSDVLVKKINESFGLIWDGNSLEECNGTFGNYERYNTPHKLSLYLSTGTPVIVWKNAAIADFVLSNNVGVVVETLHDVETVINEMNEEMYTAMKSNALEISQKLRRGYYTIQAIRKIEEAI